MKIPDHIQKIIGQNSQQICGNSKSNCFWATMYFYIPDLFPPKMINGNEVLNFLDLHFMQVENPQDHDVFVIWNSSNIDISPKEIDIHFLASYPQGFPFGLIIEHSGVILENNIIFQKASPKEFDNFEIINWDLAYSPYEILPWKKVTYHRKKT